MESERGYTLIETVVTVGILAVLLAAGGFWMVGMHPGALAQSTDDYDAAMSSARALAMSSTNGATLVFAPRNAGRDGFALRVYAGRPSAPGAVQPSTAMPVVSDATISERSLGVPPFALFVSASGHVSGKSAYPAIDASGTATFAPLAVEPMCPAGGFVLTFRGPQGATATRTLPCTSGVAVATAGPPNPSPTPNVPIVTPPQLVFHWPADARQQFVATEWGYTHWFVTTAGFSCGASVARFPDVLPLPYSAAYSPVEAAATPHPPAGTPYSYPNSNGGSTNDAPATFPLDPANEGLCAAAVADDFGQRAHTNVQVMGWLTATYRGKAYTHLSAPVLSLPAADLPSKGAAVTLDLSKTYDAEALQPAVALDVACAPFVKVTAAGGATPPAPSAAPARATATLTLVTVPGSKIDCGGTIYDQYPGSRAGEGVPFNVAIGPPELYTWPPIVHYPQPGFAIGSCAKNQPVAYDDNLVLLSGAIPSPQPGMVNTYRTNANGCLQHDNGTGWIDVDDTKAGGADAVSALVYETNGYSGLFNFSSPNGLPAVYDDLCNARTFTAVFQSGRGPNGSIIGNPGTSAGRCGYSVTSSDVSTTAARNSVGI
ncbi:MAG: type II secretion system protein, partial [Candidatus Eremiobacteraeota bacterium]|nr:type II secretion system protein [Candidatus Eremiobacteraeota bacterium]